MADLITLTEYKNFAGIPLSDTRQDAKLNAMIPAASLAVRNYTDREFAISTGIASTRTYPYDGSGILDIQDCVNIVSISTDAGVPGTTYTLDPLEWQQMPPTAPINNYVLILGGPFGSRWSGEMGFVRNLDNYEFALRIPIMSVTATWGWPAIPEDVKLATYWTVNETVNRPSGEALQSEAIEGYARSWGRGGGVETGLAIPSRSRDLLTPYQQLTVP
jgi:hypothetical protein